MSLSLKFYLSDLLSFKAGVKRSFIKIFHTFVASLVAVHCLFPGGSYITDWAAVGKVCCPLDSILLRLYIFSSFVSLVLECIWTDFEDPFHWRDEVYDTVFCGLYYYNSAVCG